jgi:hypothetical protein
MIAKNCDLTIGVIVVLDLFGDTTRGLHVLEERAMVYDALYVRKTFAVRPGM